MRKVAAVVLAASLLLALAACKKKITAGEVVEKNFTPAHSRVQLIPVTHTNGKTTYTTFIPFTYYYPDRWEVRIEAWNEEHGEMDDATYRVTKDVYDEIEIGAEFVYDEDMQPTEPEYTRERNGS